MLTPTERENYVLYGTLPPRIAYSQNNQGYVVTGNGANLNNNKIPKGYKVMPRWKYWLEKYMPTFNPSGLLQNGMNIMEVFSYFGGSGDGGNVDNNDNDNDNDNDDDNDDDNDNDNDNDNGNADDSVIKEVLSSDITKSAIKAGISLIPGGAAALAAMEAGSKVAEAANLASKIPKMKKF